MSSRRDRSRQEHGERYRSAARSRFDARLGHLYNEPALAADRGLSRLTYQV
jgi:hypothetical protein